MDTEKMQNTMYLTPKDVAVYLQVGKDKAYALCRLSGFPAIKFGASYRIDPKKFEKWLDEHIGDVISL